MRYTALIKIYVYYIYTVVHYSSIIFIICMYIFFSHFYFYTHVRGSQKLIKLKKYNLQNRNYNRLSLQLQRYCVTYEFLISFENASNIICFFFLCIYALPVHTAVYRRGVLGASVSRKSRD